MTDVSIVIVPRERFSAARESLESILDHTPADCPIVYVDGNAPPAVRAHVLRKAASRPIHYLRHPGYLSPNRARNLGLRAANGTYVAFVDNDILVTPGWLDHLVRCAEETGADVVGPLTCIGAPLHQVIHSAGLFFHVGADGQGRQSIRQSNPFADRRVADVSADLRRQPCDYVEFHCLLARRSVFDRVGPLDERLLSTREHIDFCLTVARAGGTVFCEPTAVATYLPAPPLALSDLPFFLLRWSDAWERQSLEHFQAKWQFADEEYFRGRLRNVGSMRRILVGDYCGLLLRGVVGPPKADALGAGFARFTAPLERWVSRLLLSGLVGAGDRCQRCGEEGK
jgi:GT2 family glycosyltransferase